MRKINYVFILIALVLVFHKYFLPSPLVFADAPYFYKDGLKELLNFPSTWTSRGNSLGGINLFLWIYPIMFIYGVFGTFLHLGNDLILRILFFFPSLIFAFAGIHFLTKYLKFSKTVTFFSTLIFILNTYYLLIIDGGQVGVVLAYGLFPLVLYFLIRLVDKISIMNFVLALITSFAITVVDFRVAVICVFTAFLIKLFDFKKLWILILLSICLIGLSSYWLVPIIQLSGSGVSTGISGLNTTSLLDTLFLFSPNWPSNEFGKTIAPYFYFSVIPILIFFPLFLEKNKKIFYLTFLFLIFAFLAKGPSDPLGVFYSSIINTGGVFRDSTKFFIPLILVGGILIGRSIEYLQKSSKKIFIPIVAYFYILLLIFPAILGNLNGVLGKNPDLLNFQNLSQFIKSQDGFLRDTWFIEKSPFAYHTENKQALDAKDLVNFRPFASMNAGTGDRFNFMNNKSYLDFFDLLGIKYLILNGNPRIKTLDENDTKDWNRLINIVNNDNRLTKLNIGTTFQVFETPNVHPREFFVDKTFIVIGGDDIYRKLLVLDNNFSVGNQGFLFPEDGKFDLASLENIASTSAILIFNDKTENDLKMNFLQKNFVSPLNSYYSQWAIRSSSDFLNWKYELLQNNVSTHEFDYNQGIAFSSQPNEELRISLKVPKGGDYYLIIRSMNESGSGDLRLDFNGNKDLIKHNVSQKFEWFEKGPIKLNEGNYSLNLKNTKGFQVVNTVALISSDDMKIAEQQAKKFIGSFKHFNLENKNDTEILKQVLINNKWEQTYSAVSTEKAGWIIYTDTFNKNWKLQGVNRNDQSYPIYSMINGFYVNPQWGNVKIVFNGENILRWGIYFSILSLLAIVIVVLWNCSNK